MLLEKFGLKNTPTETSKLSITGAEVHRFDPDLFMNILKNPQSVTIKTDSSIFGDKYQFRTKEKDRIATTRSDNPAVLIEVGASNCTLCVVFDFEGNGSIIHEPLVFPGGLLPEYENDQEARLHNMVEKMTKNLHEESMQVLITGSNGRGRNPQRSLMKKLMRNVFSKDRIIFHHPSEGVTYKGMIQSIRDVFFPKEQRGYIPNDPQNISGVIFVPKQLAKDDKNHLFFLHDDSYLAKSDKFNSFANKFNLIT